ncbi:MAG: T9SS type A sorting domain-containing protein [Ignavibacteriaceae bacterium]
MKMILAFIIMFVSLLSGQTQNTTLIGRWMNHSSYSFNTVDISGNYAYIVSSETSNTPSRSALNIIDISDPSSPELVGFVNGLKDSRGISINGNYAYLAAEHGCCAIYGELIIIDVSNPSSPQYLGYAGLAGYGAGLGVVNNGNYAYVVSSDGGLNVFNISTPSSPLLWGAYWPPPEEYPDPHFDGLSIAANSSYAYIANGDSGLRIIDVSSPANMEEVVGRYNTGGHAADVAVSGSYVYIADGENGLRIIEVSTPSVPTEVGFVDTDGFANDVTVAGIYAYVADGQNGLRIIDVSTPSSPQEVGFFNSGGFAADIAVNDSYIYLADRDSGLYILRNDLITDVFEELGEGMPRKFALFQNYPNPFNPTTSIRYAIDNRQFVTLKVYDVLGNEIAKLVNEEKPVGSYQAEFNAAYLPSGIYFYKLQAGDIVETKKMILLK